MGKKQKKVKERWIVELARGDSNDEWQAKHVDIHADDLEYAKFNNDREFNCRCYEMAQSILGNHYNSIDRFEIITRADGKNETVNTYPYRSPEDLADAVLAMADRIKTDILEEL